MPHLFPYPIWRPAQPFCPDAVLPDLLSYPISVHHDLTLYIESCLPTFIPYLSLAYNRPYNTQALPYLLLDPSAVEHYLSYLAGLKPYFHFQPLRSKALPSGIPLRSPSSHSFVLFLGPTFINIMPELTLIFLLTPPGFHQTLHSVSSLYHPSFANHYGSRPTCFHSQQDSHPYCFYLYRWKAPSSIIPIK